MRKLDAFAAGAGVALAVAGVWAAVAYGSPIRFAGVLAIGLLVVATPALLARGKFALQSLLRARRNRAMRGGERGSVFRSDDTVADRDGAIATVREALAGAGGIDGVEATAFEEGRGLTVTHSGFHNTFVRVTPADRLAITGASEKTSEVARQVANATEWTFSRARTNPFHPRRPVAGAPRIFLSLALVGAVVVGGVVLVDAAYPSEAYNPAEKAVLVGMDARADADPSYSTTDAKLDKATFLVDALDEKSVEIAWAGNRSIAVRRHASHVPRMERDVRSLLADVRGTGGEARTERVRRIECDLVAAKREAAAAVERTNVTGVRVPAVSAANATACAGVSGDTASATHPLS